MLVRAFGVIGPKVQRELGRGDCDVDDVAMDACMRFARGWLRWTGEGSFEDFARGFAKNAVRDHYRARARRANGVLLPPGALPRPTDPEQECRAAEALRVVSQAFFRLPCQQRRALAGYFRGEPQLRTAERMHIARSTVAVHLREARRTLAACLLERGFDQLP
ncbi:MAG: sigma-70 family RNA polymerase sigma factor [Deltaproteobacteria bacterium]|nr:sigma-70 family RNA polymerase sigma factor [Deltaproteobacteria bacterium]MBW2415309.1 sigma-70 family RNA polymerase sigma factor [Deltaproteobacteria bacterium]